MILIIDNYDSFTYNLVHLVGRYRTDLHVVRNDAIAVDEVEHLDPDLVLISPGPGRPSDAGVSMEVIRRYGDRIPILGVCLGHQAIGEVFGGTVTYAPSIMHGKTSRAYHDNRTIFKDIEDGFEATRYHSLVIDPKSLPDELEVSARTEDGVVMGVRHKTLPIEGVQFHPESVLTEAGGRMISNWLACYGSGVTANQGRLEGAS